MERHGTKRASAIRAPRPRSPTTRGHHLDRFRTGHGMRARRADRGLADGRRADRGLADGRWSTKLISTEAGHGLGQDEAKRRSPTKPPRRKAKSQRSRRPDSNREPADYKSAALPVAPRRRQRRYYRSARVRAAR